MALARHLLNGVDNGHVELHALCGFVAIDRHGAVYALSRWPDIKAKEVRARLGDDCDLPTVEAAKTLLARGGVRTPATGACSAAAPGAPHSPCDAAPACRSTWQGFAGSPAGRLAGAFGQYDRLLRDNAVQTRRLEERDRAERQHQVQRQLEERRALRSSYEQLRPHR